MGIRTRERTGEKYVEGVSWQRGHNLFATLSTLITQRTPINEAQTKEMIRSGKMFNTAQSMMLLSIYVFCSLMILKRFKLNFPKLPCMNIQIFSKTHL